MSDQSDIRRKIAASFMAEKANPRLKAAAFPPQGGGGGFGGPSDLPEGDDSGGGSGKRNIPKDHPFDPKSLKPMAKTLWAASVSLGHALTAYRHMSRLKSSTISPDGMLGGRGYVMNIGDMRKRLYDACESLSGITDTLHDEINAPHWKPRLSELDENDAEDIERFVQESQDILDNPEEDATAEEREIETENDDLSKDKEDGLEAEDAEEPVFGDDEESEESEEGFEEDLEEGDVAEGQPAEGEDAFTEDGEDAAEVGEETEGDPDLAEALTNAPDIEENGADLDKEDSPEMSDLENDEGDQFEAEEGDDLEAESEEGSFDFGDPDEVAELMAELEGESAPPTEDAEEPSFEEGDEDPEEDFEEDSEEAEEVPEEESALEGPPEEEEVPEEEETEEDEEEDTEEEDSQASKMPNVHPLKKKPKLKKASQQGSYDSSVPSGGPRVEERALDQSAANSPDAYPFEDGGEPHPREYGYPSEWSNNLHKAEAMVPDSSSDATPTEGWDWGLGHGDAANGQGAGGYENPSGEGDGSKGVYGPHSGVPGTPSGSSGDTAAPLDRINERLSQGKLPNDQESPVARSDYYRGDKGNLVNSQTSLPGEATVPGTASPGALNTDYVYEDLETPYVRYDYTTHTYRDDPLHDWVDNK